MKKTLVVLLALVSVFCALSLTACGGSSIEGTYKFYSMTIDGETKAIGESWSDGEYLSEDDATLEIKKDGTFTLTFMDEEPERGSWEKRGNDIVLTYEGGEGEMIFKFESGTLTLEENEFYYGIVLKK